MDHKLLQFKSYGQLLMMNFVCLFEDKRPAREWFSHMEMLSQWDSSRLEIWTDASTRNGNGAIGDEMLQFVYLWPVLTVFDHGRT